MRNSCRTICFYAALVAIVLFDSVTIIHPVHATIVPLTSTPDYYYKAAIQLGDEKVHVYVDTGSFDLVLLCCAAEHNFPGACLNNSYCSRPPPSVRESLVQRLVVDQRMTPTVYFYRAENDHDMLLNVSFPNAATNVSVMQPRLGVIYEQDWYWSSEAAGSLGMAAISEKTAAGKSLSLVGISAGRPFGLVLNPTGSSFLFSSSDPLYHEYSPRVQWSFRQGIAASSVVYYQFPVFDLRICGRSLLYNFTSSWPAIVDTSGACLALPNDILSFLQSHAPIDCPAGSGVHCRHTLPASVPVTSLPTLTFRMRETDDPIAIPLASLILHPPASDLCIVRAPSGGLENGGLLAHGTQQFIAFGTMVLHAVNATIIDSSGKRVGFVRRDKPAFDSTLATCKPRPDCMGEQTYFPPSNTCLPPPCDLFFFMVYDEVAGTCRVSSQYRIAIAVLLFVFLLSEYLLRDWHRRLLGRVSTLYRAAPSGSSATPADGTAAAR
jgi:hypothetical protein